MYYKNEFFFVKVDELFIDPEQHVRFIQSGKKNSQSQLFQLDKNETKLYPIKYSTLPPRLYIGDIFHHLCMDSSPLACTRGLSICSECMKPVHYKI